MRPVLKRARFLATLLGVTLVVPLGPANLSATPDPLKKLDHALTARARQYDGFSRVIVRTGTANSGNVVDALIRGAGGISVRKLPSTSSNVAVVPNAALRGLAASWQVDGGSAGNVVWGSICTGANCDLPWSIALVSGVDAATVVCGTDDGDDDETIVWGTACTDPSCTQNIWSRR
jgi:hypothetical protein